MPDKIDNVDQIRAASRRLVRELGFMRSTLASTNYPPSAVHALIELGARRAVTAVGLAEQLGLEKSSVSRLIRKLVEAGELEQTLSPKDGRLRRLILTPQGRRTLHKIHSFGRQQVTSALKYLSAAEQAAILRGLETYAHALEARHTGDKKSAGEEVSVLPGYRTGVIGRVVEMHARFYAETAGFGQVFEAKVAREFADFTARLGESKNEVWLAIHDHRISGSVAIDAGESESFGAHLRWFIVDEALRGRGVGRQLLTQAIDFCAQRSFSSVYLWTFKGLDAARHLYEDMGFTLAEERPGLQWSKEVIEQRFAR